MSFFEQAKTWWESDTAKAIATIVAVLLIPASVLAWNYATNREPSITDEGATIVDGDSDAVENGEQTAEDTDSSTGETSDTEDNDQAANDTENNAQTEGQGSAMTEENQDTPSEVGGMGSVSNLPNTSGENDYIVKRGDTVYSISQSVCGNDSFYINNMKKNYLRVGSTIEVACE